MKWDWFRGAILTFLALLVCLLPATGLVAYGAEIEFLEQLRWNANIVFYGSRNIGQSFIAKENRLNKIAVFMANPRASAEKVIFHLRLNSHEEIEPEELQSLGPSVGEIYGSMSVGQTFICSARTLSGIRILMANYRGRMNDQDVIFHLKKSPEDKVDLRKVIINTSEIKDNQYCQFDFSPIHNTQDESYYFYLESPTSYPGNAITARYTASNVYGEGERYVDGAPTIGDLLFKEVSETDLVTLEISASQIWHNVFHTFTFPTISNSRGKSFYFYVEVPEADADGAIYFQYDNSGHYSAGRMYVNGLPYQGSLTFKTYYYIGLSEVMQQFLEHLSKDRLFLIFYPAVVGLILSLLIAAAIIERKSKKFYPNH